MSRLEVKTPDRAAHYYDISLKITAFTVKERNITVNND